MSKLYKKTESETPNKFAVQKLVYSTCGKYLKNGSDSNILPSINYDRPIKLILNNISGVNHTIDCWENNPKLWKEIEKKLDRIGCSGRISLVKKTKNVIVHFNHGNILLSSVKNFDDLDITGNLNSKFGDKILSDILKARLKQQKLLPGPKAVVLTLTPRGGPGIIGTVEFMKDIFGIVDHELVYSTYGSKHYHNGEPIGSPGTRFKYANKHFLKYRKIGDDKREIDAGFFTYADSTHMFTFFLAYDLEESDKEKLRNTKLI
jgi:hypothetical protein